MISKFFIGRPVFAGVIAILIVLGGLVAIALLPVAQYPQITPPTIIISANYPGAGAETAARAVAAPIEEQLSGVEGLSYFNSSSTSSGQVTITATFEVGIDTDAATFEVNNRVQLVLPRLPEEVRRNGVLVRERSPDVIMFAALVSPDGSRDVLFLSNYAYINIIDELKRLPGVADAAIVGARNYAMRIWLYPDRMAQLGVTTTDVAQALRAQNAQYAAGKIGADPAPSGQDLVYNVAASGRLVTPEQFGDVIIRAGGPAGILRVRDIARVELGAQSYEQSSTFNGQPAISLSVNLQTNGNALEVARAVRARIDELRPGFPAGVDFLIPFDLTRYVAASIEEVIKTLFEAALLVLVVVFLFLQNWRATVIPMVAVVVSVVGTFAGLAIAGFSINTLTLFAIVLSVGIVVDDAIIVLENVERLMRERGMTPLQASLEAMREVSGALVAIVLVLSAVFIPVALVGGMAGQLYRQFAVTVAIAVVISGFVALTLTPVLCALLLKEGTHHAGAFRFFNHGFERLTAVFLSAVRAVIGYRIVSLAVFVAMLAFTVFLFNRVPTSFVPEDDQGYVIVSAQLPDAATLERTEQVTAELTRMHLKHPAVASILVDNGADNVGGGSKSNTGTVWTSLIPWNEREETSREIAQEIAAASASVREAVVRANNPPAIRGLGTAGGVDFYIQARGDTDIQRLAAVAGDLATEIARHPAIAATNSVLRGSVPQLKVDVQNEKAMSLGVPMSDIFDALQATMGSLYVNDFDDFGRTFRVQLQADAPYRMKPEDLGNVYVRSGTTGGMVPLKAVLSVSAVVGPELVNRFNGFVAARVLASTAPGFSSGQAMQAIEEAAARVLPEGYAIAWSGQSFQERRTGSASAVVFVLGLVMVFLILAALYERWRLPLAVVLAVPFAVLGALLFVWLRGMANDIYFQIGLVVLIGLAAKNAILIVEFAHEAYLAGMSAYDAAMQAARLRFRPIVMTSMAFVLGVAPLAFSTGAGAEARRSMGTGVFGGMLAATFIAMVFVPLFFTLVVRRRVPQESSEPVKQVMIRS